MNPLAAAGQGRREEPARPEPVAVGPTLAAEPELASSSGGEPAAALDPVGDEVGAPSQAPETIAVEEKGAVPDPTAEPGVEDCARITHAFDDLLARVEAAEGRFAAPPVGAG